MAALPEVEALARGYVDVLHLWLTADEFAQIAEGPLVPGDFCDDNMAMDEAWQKLGGPEWDASSQAQADRWNAAYARALELLGSPAR
jgi:hypothetical protein